MENEILVRRFFERWENSFEEMCASFLERMSKDCKLVQSGLPDLIGPASVVEFMGAARTQFKVETIRVEIVQLVSSGSCVISERVDYLQDASRRVLLTVPVVGIMECRSGKIVAWRDYFDSKPLEALGQPGAAA